MVDFPDDNFLHRLADVADAETLPRFRHQLDVTTKDKPDRTFDPVTEADRIAEEKLRAAISAAYPDHAILGEEAGETGSGPLSLGARSGRRDAALYLRPAGVGNADRPGAGRSGGDGDDEPAIHGRAFLGRPSRCLDRAPRKAAASAYTRRGRSVPSHPAHDVAGRVRRAVEGRVRAATVSGTDDPLRW
jgi:3'-phosphoadenosine 5'-phosphosulfate (PAPS) 3'-phosphatase